VVLVGGAGGVYAYALNQNKRRKAAARAAAARRAKAAAAGTSAAASPYARRAVAAPNPQQTAPQQTAQPVRNPYSSGSITGTNASANPYMKPANSQPTGSAFGAAGAAMAGQQREESNPYAAPAQARVNPYAAPAAEKPAASVSSNPYARPIGTVAPAAQESAETTGETAVRRRATRMQRYHAAENSGEENE